MAFGALDKTKLKEIPFLVLVCADVVDRGLCNLPEGCLGGVERGAATEGPVERLVAPVGPKTNEILMTIFWLKIGAAAIKALCAALILCWKEGNDLAEQWRSGEPIRRTKLGSATLTSSSQEPRRSR
jgi:hypothetical protein